jgi:chromosome segregation ATPase
MFDPVAYVLKRVQDQLENAQRLLDEVYSIGVWVQSDDCSDNRNRRRGLREFRTEIGGAQVSIRDMEAEPPPGIDGPLKELRRDLEEFYEELRPLPDSISDTSGNTQELDSNIRKFRERVSGLQERTGRLIEEYGRASATRTTGNGK